MRLHHHQTVDVHVLYVQSSAALVSSTFSISLFYLQHQYLLTLRSGYHQPLVRGHETMNSANREYFYRHQPIFFLPLSPLPHQPLLPQYISLCPISRYYLKPSASAPSAVTTSGHKPLPYQPLLPQAISLCPISSYYLKSSSCPSAVSTSSHQPLPHQPLQHQKLLLQASVYPISRCYLKPSASAPSSVTTSSHQPLPCQPFLLQVISLCPISRYYLKPSATVVLSGALITLESAFISLLTTSLFPPN
jgi:hypothetical protein